MAWNRIQGLRNLPPNTVFSGLADYVRAAQHSDAVDLTGLPPFPDFLLTKLYELAFPGMDLAQLGFSDSAADDIISWATEFKD